MIWEYEKRCVACGSKDGVINHHLSYSPEIIIPLCKKCHYYAHHDERRYGNPLRPDLNEYNALTLRDFVIALKVHPLGWACTLCWKNFPLKRMLFYTLQLGMQHRIGGKPTDISSLKIQLVPQLRRVVHTRFHLKDAKGGG